MSDKIVSVGLRFDGDAKGAQESVGQLRKGLTDLKTDGDKIKLLDGESVVARELSAELKKLEDEAKSLASASSRVVILDSAIASAERYKVKLTEANAEVRKIQATLSEAYNSGADKSLIKNLEKELTAAERAATSAGVALQGSTANIVRLNLAAGEAGITTGNLAAKKTELAETYQRLTGAIDQQSTAVKREAEYQAYLAQESERVAAAEKRVAESGFIEHQRQAAIQAQKTAEYTNFWVSALENADAAEKKAERSSEALNASFAKLGIRSAHQIEADILQVNQELLRLAQRTDLTGAEFDRAFAAGQGKIKQLRAELNGASGDITQVAQRADGMISMMGKLGLAFSGAELARQFVKVNIELENIDRTFTAITGSSALAAKELEFVRGVADRLGIDGISAAKAFAQLSAATKGTGVEGKVTREVFESVARSMSVTGKSSADTEGALQALAQMASKGVISLEEMRQQLAERLPGAMGAAAKGFGITTAELNELIESGKLTADELFPALKKGLDDLYGATGPAGAATETLAQEIAHAKNTVDQMYKSIGDSGIIKGMGGALEGLSAAAIVVSNVLVTTGKTIGTFFAAFANGDIGLRGFNENAKKAFAEIEKEALDKLVKAAMHNKVLEASLDEAGKKALAAARAQQANADATEHAGETAVAVSADWTKLNLAYGKLEKATEAAVKQAVAVAEAKNAETGASVALANAFGTELEKLTAQASAAETNAQALEQVAERKKELFAVTQGNLEALQNEVAWQANEATPQQQKVIDALQKTAEARRVDADKAIAQAAATRLSTAQANVAVQAYADNSARLGELKVAYDQAREAVAALRQEKAAGADVTARLSAAELEAARAAALYRDAQKDLEEKIKAVATAKIASISVEQAGIRLAIEQQRTIVDLSRARGDEYMAVQALLQIKKLEIQLAELTAQAKRAEATAALEMVKAKRAEWEASGQLTVAKEAELKAQEAGARVKQIEGQIAEETAARMRDLADAYQIAGDSAGSAAGNISGIGQAAESSVPGVDALTNSLQRLNNAQGGVQRGGSPQTNASSLLDQGHSPDKQIDFSQAMYKRGGSIAEVKLAQKYVDELYARNNARMLTGNPGSTDRAVRLANQAINDAVDKALSYARIEKQTGQAVDLGTSVNDQLAQKTASADFSHDMTLDAGLKHQIALLKAAGSAAEASAMGNTTSGGNGNLGNPAVPAATRVMNSTVNIVINGKRDVVNVASADDATLLTTILKQLESDAARATFS